MSDLLLAHESYAIRGAVFEVYKELGCGFLEAVYHESLGLEFHRRGIPFESKPQLKLQYKSQPLLTYYVPDFICYGQIIVEIKIATALGPEHDAQLINYLKGTHLRLGFLVNFATFPHAQIKRIVL